VVKKYLLILGCLLVVALNVVADRPFRISPTGQPGNWITNQHWNTDYLTEPSVVFTNYISGQIYTNSTGRMICIRQTWSLTTSPVNGQAQVDLLVDNTQSGTWNTNDSAQITTTVAVSLALTDRRSLNTCVPNGGIYIFTNLTSGAGNIAVPIGQTGQIKQEQ